MYCLFYLGILVCLLLRRLLLVVCWRYVSSFLLYCLVGGLYSLLFCVWCVGDCCWLVFRADWGSKIGVQKVGKMVLGYGRSAKLNFRAYRNPFRFLTKNEVFSEIREIEGLV